MTIQDLTPNTQAIALLTAPLLMGRRESATEALTPGEYKRLARLLHESQHQPADLLAPDADAFFDVCARVADPERLKRLLGRGFLLSQALERWQARSIWLVSRADTAYPAQLRARLRDDAPPLLYGCGQALPLGQKGLAVVGSRDADADLLAYTEGVGRLAAAAGHTVVSGGARGVDQAAMRGALEAGGQAVGVLADGLERAALQRDYREPLMQGRLLLLSPYDPAAGFNVGFAMARNKCIYALADAALVVSSDLDRGGTWAGAVEQLDKLRLVPVFVRSDAFSPGLAALQGKGALAWPNPASAKDLASLLALEPTPARQEALAFPVRDGAVGTYDAGSHEELYARVRPQLEQLLSPRTEAEIAAEFGVPVTLLRTWLDRMVEEGVLERLSRPVRYRIARVQGSLFGKP